MLGATRRAGKSSSHGRHGPRCWRAGLAYARSALRSKAALGHMLAAAPECLSKSAFVFTAIIASRVWWLRVSSPERNLPVPEPLKVHMLCVTLRIVGNRSLPHVPKALVEEGRLEAVGNDQRLRTTASSGLFLGRLEQLATDPLSTSCLMNPEVNDVATTTPGMAVDGRNDVVGFVLDDATEGLSIAKPCSLNIELIDPSVEKRVELRFGFTVRFHDVWVHFHTWRISCISCPASAVTADLTRPC